MILLSLGRPAMHRDALAAPGEEETFLDGVGGGFAPQARRRSASEM
jgi:hypothetical protein